MDLNTQSVCVFVGGGVNGQTHVKIIGLVKERGQDKTGNEQKSTT